MQGYVSAALFIDAWGLYPKRVVMVRKINPVWQKGLWNFPGGKVEEKEPITDAINRELREELGCRIHSKVTNLTHFAVEVGPDYTVDFFRGDLPNDTMPQDMPPLNDVGEAIGIIPVRNMPPDIIGNCRYLSLIGEDWRKSIFVNIEVGEDVSERPSW